MQKEMRVWVKRAKSHGAQIEHGGKHLRILTPDGRLVAVLSRGSKTTHDSYEIAKAFRKEGWE